MTLYPDGYGTKLVTLEQMVARHGDKMHPEFARRFFAYIVSEGGRMGVGGGWRSTQPDRPGFAPDGKSFHQDQRFASGFVGYAAVDLVHVVPGQVHRSPTWAECDNAPTFGLHTFVTGEPWHIQCVEMRGWQTWVNAGRPDPPRIVLPGDIPAPIPPIPTTEVDMIAIDYTNPTTQQWTALTYTGTQLAHASGHADAVIRRAGVQRQAVNDAELDGLISSSQTTTDPPPEFSPSRKAEWNANRG